MSKETEYWASLPASEAVSHLMEKRNEFNDFSKTSGLKGKWITSYNYYFGKQINSSDPTNNTDLMSGGREGELTLMKANHYRNVIRHILAMTTQQLPSFECRATNADVDSINQTRLGSNIVEYYFNEKRMNRNANEAAEHSLVMGSGYIHAKWDPKMGEQYQSGDQGEAIYEGDIDVTTPSVFDVTFDNSKADFGRLDWVDIREAKNKFDLAARYPKLKEKILNLKTRSEEELRNGGAVMTPFDETNDVFVYYYYHKRTEALPNGRFIMYCDDDCVLFDGALPYKRLPLFQIVPGRFFGSPYGYTDSFDLLGIQDALNSLLSTALSNNVAFGAQNVLVPQGSNITREELSDALSMITYNPAAGKPEPLQLTASSPELYGLIEKLERLFETLSGMNSIARGNLDQGKMSGVALSLIQSMAVQYSSGFQRSWSELLEDLGTFVLELLQTFASTKRMITIAGKNNSAYMKSFSSQDIQDVKRVTVKLGNPLARTTAGKVAIADTLMAQGTITPKQYLTVLETGNLESATQHQDARTSLIMAENEAFLNGEFEKVQAMVGDQHILHCQEHMAILANPNIRMNSNIAGYILKHVEEHKELYKQQDPFFALLSGEPPAQPQMFVPSGIAPPMPAPPPVGPQPNNLGPLPGEPAQPPAPQSPFEVNV